MRRLSSVILILALAASLFAQKSPHGNTFKSNCSDCHKTDSWKVDLKTISFDHNKTKFPLAGQHRQVSCKDCHISLEFDKTQTECNSCHKDVHEQTVGNECARCHTPNSWVVTNIARLHQQSRFPLIGKHATADCRDCHKNLLPSEPATGIASRLRFDPLGIECYDCHKNNYLATTQPNHVLAKYSTNCTDCHSMNSVTWNGASTNHDFFPLVSGHAIADCYTCHKSGSLSKISTDCASCHINNYSQTSNPNHTKLGISNECGTCHTTNPGWIPATFPIHSNYYVIAGAHVSVANDCATCHNGNYTNPPNTCYGCHAPAYNQTTKPNHTTSKFPTACETCHSQIAWVPSTFNHTTVYPLTGSHTTVSCIDCHTTGYPNTPNTCAGCHTPQYNQTTNPNHITAKIPKTCEVCHSTSAWAPATYNHNTVYPLTGAHATIANNCALCHANGYFSSPRICSDCHLTNYNQTSNPNHITAKFPTTCEICHSNTAWVPASFNHNTVYPLTGAHATVASNCNLCHANGYSSTARVCSDCHLTNYNQTTNPNHTTSKFPSTCETCHSNTAWVPSTFNHTSVYPLTGAHTTVACNLCHVNGYPNTPTTCVGCHQPDFNTSANPSHTKIGISTDCKICHTTSTGWQPALYPTHNTKYVITGAHVSLACVTCHNGNYNSTPNTCAGCHTPKYNATTSPNHVAAQFPNTCATCHSQTAWTPSTWNHTSYFPINTSRHNLPCATCHTNTANYAVFSCLTSGCHSQDHNQNQGSAGCYKCHPTGKAD